MILDLFFLCSVLNVYSRDLLLQDERVYWYRHVQGGKQYVGVIARTMNALRAAGSCSPYHGLQAVPTYDHDGCDMVHQSIKRVEDRSAMTSPL